MPSPNKFPPTFAQFFDQWCHAHDVDSVDLGIELNVDPRTIERWRKGKTFPRDHEVQQKLCQLTNLPRSQFESYKELHQQQLASKQPSGKGGDANNEMVQIDEQTLLPESPEPSSIPASQTDEQQLQEPPESSPPSPEPPLDGKPDEEEAVASQAEESRRQSEIPDNTVTPTIPEDHDTAVQNPPVLREEPKRIPGRLHVLSRDPRQLRRWGRLILLVLLMVVLIRASSSTPTPPGPPQVSPDAIFGQFKAIRSSLPDELAFHSTQQWSVFREPSQTPGEAPTSCLFKDTYHASGYDAWPLALCFAYGLNIPHAVVQFDMDIIRGNGGGIIFNARTTRGSTNQINNASPQLRLRIGEDQTFDLYAQDFGRVPPLRNRLDVCTDIKKPDSISPLLPPDGPAWTNIFIRPGPGVTNTITLLLLGNVIILFINDHKVATFCDPLPPGGTIGFFAAPDGSHVTDVAFSNLKIWYLYPF